MIEPTPRECVKEILTECDVNLSKAYLSALPDIVVDGLIRRGWVIAKEGDVLDDPDEHLVTLKFIRRRVREEIESGETAARDLASLSRRLQDVASEIHGIEERARVDNRAKTGTSNGATTGTTTPSSSGPLNL